MLKRTLIGACLFLLTGTVFSGDIANFQNLGFSPDSRYFMFGQHGTYEKNSLSYAEIYLVDVQANRFIPGGVKRFTSSRAANPGDDGRGAMFNLLEETLSLKRQIKIDHVITGRILYILLDGEKPKEELEFRDFETGKKYKIRLVQSVTGSEPDFKSTFHILVTVQEKSGNLAGYTVGHADYWRKDVKRYRIKQILLAPDNRSLIFVIEKEEKGVSGYNIRYMVETVTLKR